MSAIPKTEMRNYLITFNREIIFLFGYFEFEKHERQLDLVYERVTEK